jgi:hypothetical protein
MIGCKKGLIWRNIKIHCIKAQAESEMEKFIIVPRLVLWLLLLPRERETQKQQQ